MNSKRIVLFLLLVALIVAGAAYFFIFHESSPLLHWQQAEGYRWAKLPVPRRGRVGFKLLSPERTGIDFTNALTRDQIRDNRVLLNGSGVAIGDVDNDGLADIYLCRLNGPNALYKNLGNWKFREITEEAGVACEDQFSTGATFADIDGDSDLDLLVTSIGGPNACFLNDGTGKFKNITDIAGISSKTGAHSMALADIDGDGDLDLYITNYKRMRTKDLYTPFELSFENIVKKTGNSYEIAREFKDHYTLKIQGSKIIWFETAEPDFLYLNDGHGRFKRVSFSEGRFRDEDGHPVPEYKDWGLMVRFQDMDEDGDPDIYVCNDFESPDRIWINDGRGNFQAISRLAIRSTSNSSMAVDFSDIDRDGDLDFFVADMLSLLHQRRQTQSATMLPMPQPVGVITNRPQYMRNTLFINRGDNTYAEIAQFSGVQASEWTWSVAFIDVDLDGYEDLITTTGNYYDAQDADTDELIRQKAAFGVPDFRNLIFLYPKLELANFIFRNRGDLTFEETGKSWGFATIDISQGMALGDLDNDGDLDVVVNRFGLPAAVFRNEIKAPRIAVSLKGVPPNTRGIGAKIKVLGGLVPQYKEVICGGYYLSGSDQIYSFATGKSKQLTIEVTWRSGKKSVIKNARPNHIYEIFESSAIKMKKDSTGNQVASEPYFEDVSDRLNHFHHEDPYDDFARQPLLPYRLSQMGPATSWTDLNQDGREDLIIGTGKGGHLAIFVNKPHGTFLPLKNQNLSKVMQDDITAVVSYQKKNDKTVVIYAISNYEQKRGAPAWLVVQTWQKGRVKDVQKIALEGSVPGTMSLADYDLDGDLDLFVGGRVIPGQYPVAASSYLFLNQKDNFVPDTLNTKKLKNLGLVSGSVFSDLDNDGDPDLILAMDWGPVKIFQNEAGKFTDVTTKYGLDQWQGWWNGLTTGDFDEDGRLDIVATNWGLNTKYHGRFSREHPLRLYYADFDLNGTMDLIEAYFDRNLQKIVPERRLMDMARALPFIRMRMPTHKQYALSSVQEIIGPRLKSARQLQANTLAHMVFLNRGDSFEAHPLPAEAQWAPAFYVGVADFDGDGHEDLFLSQNFFAYQVETSRSDAGRGLWLKGDGQGNFQAVSGQVSGVKVYGEQRGAALADFDRDGRIDLVVTQNGNQTRLFHNVKARPGLSIQLQGPPDNPKGVGAKIRLIYAGSQGPVREIHAGAGYLSQDSPVQILGYREKPVKVQVQWPGSKTTEVNLSKTANYLIIGMNGLISSN